MIRAVFFDIVGTLVSLKTKRCPDSTKAAIRALREKGIRVYVASGRSRFELEEQEMLRGMTFDGYLTNNGQIVYDGSRNLLRTVAMVPDEVRALVDYCDERSLPLWLVSEQRSRLNYHFNDRVPVVMAEIHTEIPERCDLHTMLQEPVVKAVMFLTAQEVREGPLSFMPHARSTQWFIHGQDIIPAEGGKLPAMRFMAEANGWTPDELMAFGDSENDNEMLPRLIVPIKHEKMTPRGVIFFACRKIIRFSGKGLQSAARTLARLRAASCLRCASWLRRTVGHRPS